MSSINIQAQACVACEGKPSPENTPCAVCDAGQPAANAEPVAWFIDWPDEPDLGHYLAESPVDGARSRALVFHDTAPVAAQAQPECAELQEARHDSAHAETESERVRALAYWLEQQTYEPEMLSNAADTLRAYLEEKNQAQPLPDSLVPTAPDLEYLRDAAENTALPAFLRGQIAAAVKALDAQAQSTPVLPAETLRVCGVIADKIEDATLFQAGIYRNSELAGFVRQVLRVVSTAQVQQDGDMVSCGCGDIFPSNSYGAGFIAAAGHCENCDAAQDHELLGPGADPIRALLAERDVLRDALAGVLVDDLLPLLPAEYIAKARAALAQNVDAEPAP